MKTGVVHDEPVTRQHTFEQQHEPKLKQATVHVTPILVRLYDFIAALRRYYVQLLTLFAGFFALDFLPARCVTVLSV